MVNRGQSELCAGRILEKPLIIKNTEPKREGEMRLNLQIAPGIMEGGGIFIAQGQERKWYLILARRNLMRTNLSNKTRTVYKL